MGRDSQAIRKFQTNSHLKGHTRPTNLHSIILHLLRGQAITDHPHERQQADRDQRIPFQSLLQLVMFIRPP